MRHPLVRLASLCIVLGSCLAARGVAQESEANEPVPLSDADLRAAVFVVELEFPDDKLAPKDHDQPNLVQVGFLVEPAIGVTSFWGLQRATKSSARCWDKSKPKFTVIGADPEHDLAVLQFKFDAKPVNASAPDSGAADKASPAANGEDEEDDEAEVAPRRLLLASEDRERALSQSDSTLWLDPLAPESWARLPLHELLDEDGRIAGTPRMAQLAGLPIVDEGGAIVGMWEWAWVDARDDGETKAKPRVLPASVIRSVVEKAKREPIKSVEARYGSSPVRSYRMPALLWKKQGSVGNAISVSKKFRNLVRCEDCDGKGERQEVETKWVNGQKVFVKEWKPCARCKRSKVRGVQDLWEAFRKLSSVLSAAQPDDEREKMSADIENGISEGFDLNPGAVGHGATDAAIEQLKQDKLTPGRSIAFVVAREHLSTEDFSLWGQRVRRVDDPKLGSLLLRAPVARNTIGEGYAAFVSGAIAGIVTIDGRNVVVLDRAVVVPITSSALKAAR